MLYRLNREAVCPVVVIEGSRRGASQFHETLAACVKHPVSQARRTTTTGQRVLLIQGTAVIHPVLQVIEVVHIASQTHSEMWHALERAGDGNDILRKQWR